MIATAAEDEKSTFEKAYSGLRGWVDCFEKAELKGTVRDEEIPYKGHVYSLLSNGNITIKISR